MGDPGDGGSNPMKVGIACALAAAALCVRSYAQPPASAPVSSASPVIMVEFNDPALSPPHWILILHPDGSGHFRSAMGTTSPGPVSDIRTPSVSRDIHLSPRFAATAFDVAKSHQWFDEKCDSHRKVAFQGWKTLSYRGPQGAGSCTFNYAQDKEIEGLGGDFVAVSNTILEGARLEMLLEHDPLGLEQEIEGLSSAVADGRAQQVCAIKGILERLAEDDNVMEMVRKRARLLLAKAEKG